MGLERTTEISKWLIITHPYTVKTTSSNLDKWFFPSSKMLANDSGGGDWINVWNLFYWERNQQMLYQKKELGN